MKERPILFSAPMVRAILEGRKTQTRRVIKRYDPATSNKSVPKDLAMRLASDGKTYIQTPPCPYGKPGDMLWVREAFSRLGYAKGEKVYYRADGDSQFMGEGRESNGNVTRYYTDHWERNGEKKKGSGWKPSIHMPRWASRIDLEITGVRIEHLQDISEEDSLSEGCFKGDDRYFHSTLHPIKGNYQCWVSARQAFEMLWKSINGVSSWDENPWVYVVEFKRVKP